MHLSFTSSSQAHPSCASQLYILISGASQLCISALHPHLRCVPAVHLSFTSSSQAHPSCASQPCILVSRASQLCLPHFSHLHPSCWAAGPNLRAVSPTTRASDYSNALLRALTTRLQCVPLGATQSPGGSQKARTACLAPLAACHSHPAG